MERYGHLHLEAEVRQRLEAASAATIDRLLKPVRKTAGIRRKKRPGKRMSREIPVKTSHDWVDSLSGQLGNRLRGSRWRKHGGGVPAQSGSDGRL